MDNNDDHTLSETDRRRGLIASIASIAIFGASLGHSLPFFAVLLEGYGASNSIIGLNSATPAVASLMIAPFIPNLIANFGIRRIMMAAFAVIYLGYGLAFISGDKIWLWFIVRLFFGFGGAALFIASEVWINLVAPPERRGSVIGIYGTALAAGFAAGPLALEVTGYDGIAPFIAGVLFLLAASPPILTAPAPKFAVDAAPSSLLRIARLVPVIFVAVVIFAAAEGVMMGLAPVYGIRLGMDQATAGRIVFAYALGPIAFQYLIGKAVDRFEPIVIFSICASLGVIGAFALPYAAQHPVSLYTLLIFWGGAIVGLNTCGLTMIGHRFRDRELAAANAGLAFAYSTGALIGPATTGPMMDIFGPNALAYTLGAFFTGLVVFIAATRSSLMVNRDL